MGKPRTTNEKAQHHFDAETGPHSYQPTMLHSSAPIWIFDDEYVECIKNDPRYEGQDPHEVLQRARSQFLSTTSKGIQASSDSGSFKNIFYAHAWLLLLCVLCWIAVAVFPPFWPFALYPSIHGALAGLTIWSFATVIGLWDEH